MTRVVTFYSYKGGVGRTMALVNVAHTLAHRGLRVLMLDLDLEAPGMTHFFANQVAEHAQAAEHAGQTNRDALDLLLEVKRICAHSDRAAEEFEPVSLDAYVVPIPVQHQNHGKEHSRYLDGRLDLMPAPLDPASSSREYLERLGELDLPGIFGPDGLRHRFGDEVRRYLENVRFVTEGDEMFTLRPLVHAAYDLVLVDSRTGLNESSGLCIGPLCDALVVCTGLNEQNVAGTEYFLRQAGLFDQEKSKKYAVVVGPIPPWSRSETATRLERIRKAFPVAQVITQVPYHPAAALGEPVFVTSDRGEPISLAYEALATSIIELTRLRNVDLPQLRHDSPAGWAAYQQEFARALPSIRISSGISDERGREAKSPRPFPTAVTLDALGNVGSDDGDSIAVAVAMAALRLNSPVPFERMIETSSKNRGEYLSANLLFMRLRLLDRLPLGKGETWVTKLLERAPSSAAHSLAMAYAAGLGLEVGETKARSIPWPHHLFHMLEPPLLKLFDGLEGNFLEAFFHAKLPEEMRTDIAQSTKNLDKDFERFAGNQGLAFGFLRAPHVPPGLWPIPFIVGLLALARGVSAVDEIMRWLEQCRLVHGYAWRVLVDPRHLAPIAKHPRFVAFVEEEDQRVAKIEAAIDSGEFAL